MDQTVKNMAAKLKEFTLGNNNNWTLYTFKLVLVVTVITLSFAYCRAEKSGDFKPSITNVNAGRGQLESVFRSSINRETGEFNFPAHIIFKPKARLYTGENLTGNSVDYDGEEDGCDRLNIFFRGKIRSLDTFGTCIRLYTGFACDGESLAVYPRIKSRRRNGAGEIVATEINQESMNLRHEDFPLSEIKSFGPCFENELNNTIIQTEFQRFGNLKPVEGASSNETGSGSSRRENMEQYRFKKLEVRPTHLFVPDNLLLDQDAQSSATFDTPIYWYKSGKNGRLEFLRAFIEYKHINANANANGDSQNAEGHTENPADISLETAQPDQQGSNKTDEEFYATAILDKEETDVMGRFISSSLGPQKNLPKDLHNVFPQTQWNLQKLGEREERMVKYLKQNEGKILGLTINIDYENENATRPLGFSHIIRFNGEFTSRVYLTNLY